MKTAKAIHPRIFGIYAPCPVNIDEELQKVCIYLFDNIHLFSAHINRPSYLHVQMVDEFLDADSQRSVSDPKTDATDVDKDSLLGDLNDIKEIDQGKKNV